MSTPQEKRGLAELSDARRESRTLFWFVGIFSFFVNLLIADWSDLHVTSL